MSPAPTSRLSAEERRERVLEAATRAFGRSGYAATSTDAVAKEAGVSQPYVVRIFGTKLELFLEVVDRATRRVRDTFVEVVESGVVHVDDDGGLGPLGDAYARLVLADRPVMQVMMHGFMASSEPAVGQLARRRMGEIHDVVMRTGCTTDQAREFIAQGMLLNVMLAIGAPEHLDESPAIEALTICAFGPLLDAVVDGRDDEGRTG
ncbi:TetR/AcrR family transcriptional regulator [Aeromicrobium sp.]|uniref:TetR/AcrR family transcriptional regulator n=1 Tax=Aeromicrobium sp. TaxID=1871063 RepID=UPI00351597E4